MLAVKSGEVPRSEVSAEIGELETQVRALLDEDQIPLPKRANLDDITAWTVSAQRRQWDW